MIELFLILGAGCILFMVLPLFCLFILGIFESKK